MKDFPKRSSAFGNKRSGRFGPEVGPGDRPETNSATFRRCTTALSPLPICTIYLHKWPSTIYPLYTISICFHTINDLDKDGF
jgi:hypothetical protein